MTKSDNLKSRRVDSSDDAFEQSYDSEQADEISRDYYEAERRSLRFRAEKALSEVTNIQEQKQSSKVKKREVENSIECLERIVECMADEPLPCISTETLESDEWFEYDAIRYQYSITGNMSMLLDAFVLLVGSGVTPGKWILEPLADAFNTVLEDRDPDLVATRLKLRGKGSGSKSPLQDYHRTMQKAEVHIDMRTLIEKFDVSQTKAANAVIEKYQLKISPKTLVNKYQVMPEVPKLVQEKIKRSSDSSDSSIVWLTDSAKNEFLDSFPLSARKYLKDIYPEKT